MSPTNQLSGLGRALHQCYHYCAGQFRHLPIHPYVCFSPAPFAHGHWPGGLLAFL
jgi:hypothetical protein